MNNERYQEIIDEAYKKYKNSHWIPPSNPNGKRLVNQLWGFIPQQHNRDTFIKEIKTNPKFSERWGLKIEERILLKQVDQTNPILKGSTALYQTKLIIVTYNNEKIEVYE